MKQIFNLNELESIYNSCPEEKETTISILGNEKVMDVYTSDNTMLTKLKKVWNANPDTVECYEAGRCENKVTGYIFKMNKKHLSFRSAAEKGMSEEARAAFGERVRNMYAEGKLGRK